MWEIPSIGRKDKITDRGRRLETGSSVAYRFRKVNFSIERQNSKQEGWGWGEEWSGLLGNWFESLVLIELVEDGGSVMWRNCSWSCSG